MTKKDFILKWNIGYESKEQFHEFKNEMMNDLNAVISAEASTPDLYSMGLHDVMSITPEKHNRCCVLILFSHESTRGTAVSKMGQKLKHKTTKKTIVHCISVGQSDYSFCGHDLAGDTEYDSAVRTTEKINCEDCISIINFCKRLPDNVISSKTIGPYTWAGR